MTIKKQPNSRMCFVCGHSNAAGIHVRFYEQEDGSVLARFTGTERHQGYPGRLHGGVITSILDETAGRAIMIGHGDDIWGVTVEINVHFRQPVPLDVELTAVGRVTSENRRVFEGVAELHLPDGTVAADASGKYIKMAITQIADFDFDREEWAVVPD